MTPDHQARTAADTITTVASKIARWAANVHALDIAPARHYTVDRQPGRRTPVSPKVARSGVSDPTMATVDNADRIVDQVLARLVDCADLVEESARWRGHEPDTVVRTPSGFLHPSMATQHGHRLVTAAKWLADWVSGRWDVAMGLDAGDVRGNYLVRESVRPAVETLSDVANDLQRVRRRWVVPAPAGGRLVLCACGCRRVADHGRHNRLCANAPNRCDDCGTRPVKYQQMGLCDTCRRRQLRAKEAS